MTSEKETIKALIRDSLGHPILEDDAKECRHLFKPRRPRVQINLNPEELAYLAGIVDGEGTVCTRKQQRPYGHRIYLSPVIRVINTDTRLMNWLSAKLPYSISPVKPHAVPGIKAVKPLYEWRVEGSNAKTLLEKILPYLTIKKQKSLDVIDTCLKASAQRESL